MQCHNCPKSITNGGTPDEECIKCKCAEYLDNDHKIITPVDDILKVESLIDDQYSSNINDSKEDVITFTKDKTKRNLEDCRNVLDVLKGCHHSSFKHIATMVALFLSLGTYTPMMTTILDGGTLTEYARLENKSKQNAHQIWNRIVDNNPIINGIAKKNKNKIKFKENVKRLED